MKTLHTTFRKLRKDTSGQVGIMFGLSMIPALMFIGAGIDYTSAYKNKQRIQAAADAAVLAAAGMPYGTSNDVRRAMATNVFTANTQDLGISPVASVSGNSITVTASYDSPTSFIKIAHVNEIRVLGAATGNVSYSTSTATTETTTNTATGGKVCVLALDPNAEMGIQAQGTPNVDYTGCWAHTNSTKAGAISGGGSASIVGAGHSAVGGVTNAGSEYSPAPLGGRPVTPDPFATVGAYVIPYSSYTPTFTPPALPDACKSSNIDLKKGTFSLEPGRYCGGINIQAGATVTLAPGIYIIDNGALNVQSGSSLIGTNVMFYFRGPAARMTIIGGGTVNVTGRATGSSYEGFLAIQHPDAWRGLDSNIQGGGTFKLTGVIYMPTQRLIITGNGDANQDSPFFGIVAKNVQFRGNGIFRLKPHTSAAGMPDILPNRVTTTTTTTTVETHPVERVILK